MAQNVAVVVGVGPGLGASVARRFAREGFAVALVARGKDKLEPVQGDIEKAGGSALSVTADATDPASVSAAFSQIREQLGDPTVLVYNAGTFVFKGIVDTAPEEFETCWKANCMGGFLAAREVLPAMVEAGRGTILLTGATASLRGGGKFANLAVGKFGLRALAQSMAREFHPQGIHVAHVIVDGQIDGPKTRARGGDRPDETFLAPDSMADTYWHLHSQPPSTWTHELDLRPHVETF